MERKTRFATKRPHSTLPGVGGVNTTREQIAHPVGSSLVFRSKMKQSKRAAFLLSMRAKNVSYNNIVSFHLNACLGIVARRR